MRRFNMALGLNIIAINQPVNAECHVERWGGLIVGAVDNHLARRELERVRATALEPILTAIATRQDGEERARLFQHLEFGFIGWPDKLQKQAVAAIREALNQLSAGTPRAELERTKERVIERFRRLYQRHERKSHLIESGLRQPVAGSNHDFKIPEEPFSILKDRGVEKDKGIQHVAVARSDVSASHRAKQKHADDVALHRLDRIQKAF